MLVIDITGDSSSSDDDKAILTTFKIEADSRGKSPSISNKRKREPEETEFWAEKALRTGATVENGARSAVIQRSKRIFSPPRSRVPSLNELYNEKLSRIKGPEVSLSCRQRIRDVEFNFEFISSYKLHKGVTTVDPNFQGGCGCIGQKCNLFKCTCPSQEPGSTQNIVPYMDGRFGTVILREDFIGRKAMIYECSDLCGCGPYCANRVVYHGRTVKLDIFETKNRGFGLRAKNFIQKGQYIDRYLGEVIPKILADDREAAVTGASYLFQLEFIRENDINVVDGRKFGSITRFMNHSCEPNCKMFPVSHNHADEGVYGLAFFAIADIPEGTELTFDYNPDWMSTGKKVDSEAVKCLCGAVNCRGQLWPNQRKTLK